MTAALEGGEWSAAHPGRTLPPGKTRCQFYRRLVGSQGLSGRTAAIPTELPGPLIHTHTHTHIYIYIHALNLLTINLVLYYSDDISGIIY